LNALDLRTIVNNIQHHVAHEPAPAAPSHYPCGWECSGCGQSNAGECSAAAGRVVAAGADRVSCCTGVVRRDPAIASIIDHTLLKPEATRDDIRRLCAEARQYGFASVCVNPYWVPLAVSELSGSPGKVCTVAGFPLGASTAAMKRAEAEAAIAAGAQEIDMVINVGALRSGDYHVVDAEIRAVAGACHRAGAIVKTILETALLDQREKAVACAIARLAGADFVKTSTGFASGGATAEDVALMRRVVGPEVGVKAAGGIRTVEDFQRMVAAGATRIGASASVKIVEAAAA
jgi:deoxyribose-phosphate aldolase